MTIDPHGLEEGDVLLKDGERWQVIHVDCPPYDPDDVVLKRLIKQYGQWALGFGTLELDRADPLQ